MTKTLTEYLNSNVDASADAEMVYDDLSKQWIVTGPEVQLHHSHRRRNSPGIELLVSFIVFLFTPITTVLSMVAFFGFWSVVVVLIGVVINIL